jgi:hypothetical protein
MNRPRAYVETSVPSFCVDERTDPAIVARRGWTREWWGGPAKDCELVTSVAVMEELGRGPAERSADRLALVQGLPLLAVEPSIAEIVSAYVRHRVMPANPEGDALHLALASFHKCDFLVTWNCRHLANANKFGHIRRVNTLLGLFVPSLVTPLQLLGATDDADPE